MKKITFVTGNSSKILSAKQILEPLGIEVDHVKMDTTEIQADSVEEIAMHSAKEASEKGEEPIVQPLKIEDLQGNEKTPTAEKTEAQSVDAFIAKLRQMSEKEAAKDAQNKDNKEQPDYLKYVARHARKVEAQKQRDDEGR